MINCLGLPPQFKYPLAAQVYNQARYEGKDETEALRMAILLDAMLDPSILKLINQLSNNEDHIVRGYN